MRVSAIIPTYNRKAHVLRAVDSVLAQTVPVDEIIVVDDGSTDGTGDLLRIRYGSRVVVLTQENKGVSAARNRGIREAQGEWVAFLDSDDIWFPEKMARQIGALSARGCDCGVCFTDNRFANNPDMAFTRFEQTGFLSVQKIGLLEELGTYIVAGMEPYFTSSLLIRRSLIDHVGGFDEALFIREDSDLMFRLSLQGRICFVGLPLVQVDRDPSRSVGLCNLFSSRDDRVFECLERVYIKWLAMPEIAGSRYERPIRDLLRLVYYDSVETKMRDFRIRRALYEIGRLRSLGESYTSLASNLWFRKVTKMRQRKLTTTKSRDRGKPGKQGLDLA